MCDQYARAINGTEQDGKQVQFTPEKKRGIM